MTILFVQTPEGQTHSIQAGSLDEIRQIMCERIGLPLSVQKFHYGGRSIEGFQNLSDYSTITLFLGLEGGKGGFGSLLRNQAQTRRKITNWDHSRDREGRRIGNVKNEGNLVEFFKKRKEEETKIQNEIEQVKIIQNTLKQGEIDIRLDQEYKNKLEKSEKMIEKSVLIAKSRTVAKIVRKRDKITKDLLEQIDEAINEQEQDNNQNE